MNSAGTHDKRPDARSYSDCRAYLMGYYQWRKTNEVGFSYGTWSSELGIKSRSYLRLLLVGKRTITDRSAPIFVAGLKLSRSEGQYFTALVQMQNARTIQERESLLQEMRKLSKRVPCLTQITDARQFLSSIIVPRIQVLLADNEIEHTIPNLARLLGRKVTEVREAIEILERLKLAERREQPGGIICWKATVESFDVDDQADASSIQSYHRSCLEEAARAVSLPMNVRKFDSLVLALTQEEYGELVTEIRACVDRFLSQFPGTSPGSARLYQMNMNLIPVSEPFLHPDKRPDAPEGYATTQVAGPNPITHGVQTL